MKTIYLEPDEEIISVIDRLTQTKSKEINFVVPAGAQICQNSINLKLLKREADSLGKELTLFVPDDLKAEVAEKVGFTVKREKNLPIELIREEKGPSKPIEPAKEDMIGLLVEELKPEREKKRSFLWPRHSKEPRKRMVDIVRPGGQVGHLQQAKERFFPQRFLKKKPIRPVPQLEPIPPSRWPKFLIIFIILAFAEKS